MILSRWAGLAFPWGSGVSIARDCGVVWEPARFHRATSAHLQTGNARGTLISIGTGLRRLVGVRAAVRGCRGDRLHASVQFRWSGMPDGKLYSRPPSDHHVHHPGATGGRGEAPIGAQGGPPRLARPRSRSNGERRDGRRHSQLHVGDRLVVRPGDAWQRREDRLGTRLLMPQRDR